MTLRTSLSRSLAATLEREIATGRWPTGSKLPTERELATRMGVSRQTVREALEELERASLIVRRQGSGTYVAERRLEQSLLGHFSIVDALRASGAVVDTTVLSQTLTTAPPTVAESLAIERDAPVLELERLRRVDGEPLMVESTWLPAQLLEGVEETDFSATGLYELLRERYGIVLVRAVESFEPVVLHADEAAALGVAAGEPALMLLRTTFDAEERPVEYARALLRADRCRTLVERRVEEPERGTRPRLRRRAGE